MTFVPERWDVGLWDEAHWDGQLGIDAAATPVTITPRSATFSVGRKLTAASTPVIITANAANLVATLGFSIHALSTPVTITPQPANLIVTHRLTLTAEPAAVVITGNAADLIVHVHHQVMQAITAQIHIIPSLAGLEVWRSPTPFPQPGRITMGRPKTFVDRW